MPTPWPDYQSWLSAAWAELLSTEPPEAKVQSFLERNPPLVPGTNEYGAGHHGPHQFALYAESELQGLGKNRRPDFMWITATSGVVSPVFIEIEAPEKRYFRKGGDQFTAEFNQALGQLKEWKTWWGEPENQTSFRRNVLDPIWNFNNRRIKPVYILVYGRRREFNADTTGALNRLRAYQADHDEEIMTFDRLQAKASLANVACVRQRSNGALELRGIPASFTTGPHTLHLARRIDKPTESVFRNPPLWSDERTEYIRRRWQYWGDVGREFGTEVPRSSGPGE